MHQKILRGQEIVCLDYSRRGGLINPINQRLGLDIITPQWQKSYWTWKTMPAQKINKY